MPARPAFKQRLSGLPSRLKSYNGGNSSTPPTKSASTSPERGNGMSGSRDLGLCLKTTVLKGRNLAAKDKSGTSDPYLVVTLGDARESTSTINKTLNPEWNQKFDLPVVGPQSLLLEATCWDKDRFGKDYMGEFDIAVEDIFANGQVSQEPKWYHLRSGKKKSTVSGDIQMQFSLTDRTNPSATPQQIMAKLQTIVVSTPGGDSPEDDDDELERLDSGDVDEDEDEEGIISEVEDAKGPEAAEKKRRKLRLKKLRRRATRRAFEYSGSSDLAGVVFLEVTKCQDLPPERNMTRTSFDMDPFVVTSLGRKTYRTKVVRHNLNPVFEEKLVFQVLKHETGYSLNFAVVDRDKLSGNDFIGTANFPLETIIAGAPTVDATTGLYDLPEPPDPASPQQGNKKSRFRIPLSRSSSSQSLNRMNKPTLRKEDSSNSLSDATLPTPGTPNLAPRSAPLTGPTLTPTTSLPESSAVPVINVDSNTTDDPDLKVHHIPLTLKNKEKWEEKHKPMLTIRAKYLPYKALRQQFWRAMLKQYDADDSYRMDKTELTMMLDTLGSTLHESTIDSWFKRFAAENKGEDVLTFDQAVISLEDELQKAEQRTKGSPLKGLGVTNRTPSNMSKTSIGDGSSTPYSSGINTPLNKSQTSMIPAMEQEVLGKEGEEGAYLSSNDLNENGGEEHVIEISECPICHQPRLKKRSDADIITHIATCASQDWRQVNNLVMAGFVTSSQAQRKWYTKIINKVGYGGYKIGANSANTLVQDRITGQINEERMSVYVRLGIRLLYKGLNSEMEKKRARKLLKSLSVKQGKKYDDPASAADIPGFIEFHQLDMGEVLLPMNKFKSFNEFFYRALKPDARPCSAPDHPAIITSPADCRTVVFNTLEIAQGIWVKGREFTVERLLGKAYPEEAKRYRGGALGIFRLAPQDYHRFHIPVDGVMGEPKLIEGEYYTVNPMAIRSALDVYGENVRVLVPIDSVRHGKVMVVCVGAMMVGSTVITRKAGEKVARAEELGYFKFGGSTILLLFEPGVMQFDDDLVDNSNVPLETLVRVGMSIGHSPDHAPHTPDMQKSNPTMEEKQDAKRRIEGSLAPPAQGHAPIAQQLK